VERLSTTIPWDYVKATAIAKQSDSLTAETSRYIVVFRECSCLDFLTEF